MGVAREERNNIFEIESGMMAEFPMLPLWTDAYLADTTHLTMEEHGVYLMLLIAAWRDQDCSLPDNDQKLQRICRMSDEDWSEVKATVMAFWDLESGRWTQKRLLAERVKAKAVHEQRLAASRKGVEARTKSLAEVDRSVDRSVDRRFTNPHPHPHPHKSSLNSTSKPENTFSLNGEVVGEETTPSTKAKTKKRVRFDNYEECKAYVCGELELTENDALWFWEHMESQDWKVNGRQKYNIKLTASNWERKGYFPSQEQGRKR